MPSRPLTPETAMRVRLNAAASRAVYNSRPPAEIVAELQEIAGARTDLLSAELGLVIGSWRARSVLQRHEDLAAEFEALNLPGMAESIALGDHRQRTGGHTSESFTRGSSGHRRDHT